MHGNAQTARCPLLTFYVPHFVPGFTYCMLFSPFVLPTCNPFWVFQFFFRFNILFPFLFVRSFNFSFYLFIMSFPPCLRHSLFPFFLLLSHSFISPSLSIIYSCFYPSFSFPFYSPISCILCSFLQLLLPSLSVTPCSIDQHRT
jgi:hypothetical protein